MLTAAPIAIISAFTPFSPMKEHDATTTYSAYFCSTPARPPPVRGQRHRRATPTPSRTARPGRGHRRASRARLGAAEKRSHVSRDWPTARRDLHTAYSDIQAELLAIRVQTIEEARELRALELERLDAMTVGLWPGIQAGNAATVGAGVRVSERRAKLFGLDEPTATKTEISGSLSVDAEIRLKAEVEDLQRWLTLRGAAGAGGAIGKIVRCCPRARAGAQQPDVPSGVVDVSRRAL